MREGLCWPSYNNVIWFDRLFVLNSGLNKRQSQSPILYFNNREKQHCICTLSEFYHNLKKSFSQWEKDFLGSHITMYIDLIAFLYSTQGWTKDKANRLSYTLITERNNIAYAHYQSSSSMREGFCWQSYYNVYWFDRLFVLNSGLDKRQSQSPIIYFNNRKKQHCICTLSEFITNERRILLAVILQCILIWSPFCPQLRVGQKTKPIAYHIL